MKNKERLFEVLLGIMLNIVNLMILLGSYMISKSVVLSLILSMMLLPVFFFGTKLIYRPREKILTIEDVRKKILRLKKRKFIAFILGS